MRFNINFNQVKAIEWDLNLSQGMLFSFLYELPSWADSVTIDGVVYYFAATSKIIEELPILTDKNDTIKRIKKQLSDKDLIKSMVIGGKQYVALTDKAKTYNCSDYEQGKISHTGNEQSKSSGNFNMAGKKIPEGGEKNTRWQGNFSDILINKDNTTKDKLANAHAHEATKTEKPKPQEESKSSAGFSGFSSFSEFSEVDQKIAEAEQVRDGQLRLSQKDALVELVKLLENHTTNQKDLYLSLVAEFKDLNSFKKINNFASFVRAVKTQVVSKTYKLHKSVRVEYNLEEKSEAQKAEDRANCVNAFNYVRANTAPKPIYTAAQKSELLKFKQMI